MAGVQQEVAANKPTQRHRPGLEVDEQDNVADFMEASCRMLKGSQSGVSQPHPF